MDRAKFCTNFVGKPEDKINDKRKKQHNTK